MREPALQIRLPQADLDILKVRAESEGRKLANHIRVIIQAQLRGEVYGEKGRQK